MVEMREAAFILEGVSPKSLVLINELGRGSSNLCGIALATAISEKLVRSGVRKHHFVFIRTFKLLGHCTVCYSFLPTDRIPGDVSERKKSIITSRTNGRPKSWSGKGQTDARWNQTFKQAWLCCQHYKRGDSYARKSKSNDCQVIKWCARLIRVAKMIRMHERSLWRPKSAEKFSG